jgi:ElaB/YqjD/DUF883 family membrane-anchored ribosome-binding protein
MTAENLRALERDVETARTKLAEDLAGIRDPRNFAALKHDVKGEITRTKDDLLDKAKQTTQDAAQNLLDQVKERAIANPAAAAAIGAGLAWRFLHKPPIASILVGIGVFSLWRTTPDIPSRANREESFAKRYGDSVSSQVSQLTDSAKTTVQEWAGQAQDAVQQGADDFSKVTREKLDQASVATQEIMQDIGDRTVAAGQQAARTAQSVATDENRDNFLLGAAALAIAAAVGMSYQRGKQAD